MGGAPTHSDIQHEIRKLIPLVKDQYQLESIALFGSYVRGTQGPDSDLDLLVAFREPPSLFKFLQLERFLSEKLGVKVDLVMKSALKPRIGERILREALPV